jgi:tetratricopeptide (TPR) repeat protein
MKKYERKIMSKKAQHYHEDFFTKLTKKIEHFIQKHLKIIVVSISSAVVILAVYFTLDFVFSKYEKKAYSAFGKVYLVYNGLQDNQNIEEDELKKKLIELNEDFKIVLNDYPRSKAAIKSAYFIGNSLYENGNYEEAIEYFQMGYSIKSRYLTSILCLQGEASCYEQLGDYGKAIEIYEAIIKDFNDQYIVPTILYNLGQVHEKKNEPEKANERYSQIISDYQWSGWRNFAEKRVLLLKNLM